MPSVTHYLNRAREIGVAGTAERVWNRTGGAALLHGQALAWRVKASRKLSDAALLEATSGRWTGVGALVQHLALRQPATFLLPLDAPEAARAELEARYPGYVERILAQADEACAGRFNLLHQPAAYPDGIDWLRCPETAGRRRAATSRSLSARSGSRIAPPTSKWCGRSTGTSILWRWAWPTG